MCFLKGTLLTFTIHSYIVQAGPNISTFMMFYFDSPESVDDDLWLWFDSSRYCIDDTNLASLDCQLWYCGPGNGSHFSSLLKQKLLGVWMIWMWRWMQMDHVPVSNWRKICGWLSTVLLQVNDCVYDCVCVLHTCMFVLSGRICNKLMA